MKIGGGTMVYGGNAQNSNTGMINVNEGTLRLNKTAGTGPIAVRGNLTINDLTSNYDPVGSAAVIYTAGSRADQIGAFAVNVNGNGTFDFNGITDTIAVLTVNGGTFQNTAGGGTFTATGLTMTGGTVNTGTGTLNLTGNSPTTLASAPGGAATVNGNLNLGGATGPSPITDGVLLNELTVNAAPQQRPPRQGAAPAACC